MIENLKDAVDSKAPLAAAERKNEQSLNEKIDAILSRVACTDSILQKYKIFS